MTGERVVAADAKGMALARDGARLGTWPVLAAVLSVIVAVSLLLWPTVVSLHREWTDTEHLTFVHGYLVAALGVWLLWRATRSSDFALQPARSALWPLAALSLCWLIALRSGIELAHQVIWPAMLLASVCVLAGWRSGLRCAFPIGLLYFAVPVWTLGDGALQQLSVDAVELMLRVTAVPSYVEGNVVHLPQGTFVIEGGCNGMHFFIVGLAMAAVFGEMHRDAWRTRLWQFALAALVALLANWIRIYVVIVAGHLTDMQHYLVSVSHYYFGWAVFAVCMVLYFWIVSRAPLQPARAAGLGHGTPRPAPVMSSAALAVAAAGLGPLLGVWNASSTMPAPEVVLPVIDSWQGPQAVAGDWQPRFAQPDGTALGSYRQGDLLVQAFVAEYREQRQGKELVGFGNSVVHGIDGAVVQDSVIEMATGRARQLLVDGAAGASVVLYYYDIGGRRRVQGITAQLTYGFASLASMPLSSVVAVRAHCAADCAAASLQAQRVLDALHSARNAPLP